MPDFIPANDTAQTRGYPALTDEVSGVGRDVFLNPVEAPLPAGAPVESIAIDYPDGDVSLLGWRMHWLVAFFILTLVFALALQRPLGVRL